MRIIYGVAGEGFGHAARAKEILRYLRKKHEVLVFTYGQGYDFLKNEDGVVLINGASVSYNENTCLSISKTFLKNSYHFLYKNLRYCGHYYKYFKKFNPNICITDMEPMVSWLSYICDIPLISLDNQHDLIQNNIAIPIRYKTDYLLAKTVVRTWIPKADSYVVLSFKNDISRRIREHMHFVDPVIRGEVATMEPSKQDKIIVYLSRWNDSVINVLRGMNENFVVYNNAKTGQAGKIQFKRVNHSFHRDLADCKAVIANAGFTLISECMLLKKPYLALPLGGQFEQVYNAASIKKLGIGDFCDANRLRKNNIELFIKKLKHYEDKFNSINIDPNEAVNVLSDELERINHERKHSPSYSI